MEQKDFIIRQLLADIMNLKVENATLKYMNHVQKEELANGNTHEAEITTQPTEESTAD